MASLTEQTSLYHLDNLQIPSSQVVLVYTEWNQPIIDALRKGALKVLAAYPQIQIKEILVPGAMEINYTIAAYQRQSQADAFIALGCVIRGDTPHFDFVCRSVTDGVTQLNLNSSAPVIFGVLTVNNEAQAWERLGGKHGHKGEEAGIAALKMLAYRNSLKS